MSVLIHRTTLVERSTAADTDECIGWCAIPSGGVFRGATLRGSVMGVESTSTLGAIVYGLSGYVLPVLDPDTIQATPDLLWDLQVPKDSAILENTLDYDNLTTAVTTPDVTPGEIDLEQLVDSGNRPVQLFKTERMVTFAQSPTGFIAGTPDAYFPTDLFAFRVKRQVRVRGPSVVLFALSAPTPGVPSIFTGDTSSWAPRTNDEWYMLRFIGDALERGAVFLHGASTTEDEPWEASMELAGRMMEQTFEDTTGAFLAGTKQSFTKINYTIEVPGHLNVKSLRGAV